jgi:restriction system protein
MAEPTPGAVRYANLKQELSLEGIKSVLSDDKFSKIIKSIEK